MKATTEPDSRAVALAETIPGVVLAIALPGDYHPEPSDTMPTSTPSENPNARASKPHPRDQRK